MLNQEETLAAREKQKRIKEQFRALDLRRSGPHRAARAALQRHLQQPPAAPLRRLPPRLSRHDPHITLYPHQKDAVWRVMSSGNTLLAHAVGAGKTYVMVAAGMKMKQAGLITKPLYVVPNHMLEQFAPRVPAALPQREAPDRRQGGLHPRAAQAPDREDGQRRVGRHHHHPQLLRAHRHVAARTRSGSCGSRSPSTTSSCATAPPPRPPARTATSSRPSRSRKPGARSG